MKYIKTLEKYTHTSKDQADDMLYIDEFSRKFEDMFEYRLNITSMTTAKFRTWVGYGANKSYVGEFVLNNKNILSKKILIKYKIYIETAINPNGIKDGNDIDRTFSISFDIDKSKSRNVNSIKHFYDYSRNVDDLLQEFDQYLIKTLGIKYLTEDQIKQKETEKSMRKYNL